MNAMLSITEFITEAKRLEIQHKKEGISIVNKILSKDETTQEEIKDQLETLADIDGAFKHNGPCIYCFVNPDVKDAIKIGYTDQHPEKRIAQWKEIYGAENVNCLGYWSSEVIDSEGKKVFFWDHAVHEIVIEKGHKRLEKNKTSGTFFLDDLTDSGKAKIVDIPIHYSKEFFRKFSTYDTEKKAELNEVLLEQILNEMKRQIIEKKAKFRVYHFTKEGGQEGRLPDVAWKSPDPYDDTGLQKEAIKNALKLVKNEHKTHLLMAAVMRFGKTHTAYEIVHQLNLKRVVVVSAKADVRAAWKSDINHKDFYKDFVFIEINDKYNWSISAYDEKEQRIVTKTPNIGDPLKVEELYKDKTIIYFFTLQDLSGNLSKTKSKHEHIFSNEFDMMIVDETHYGSHASSFGKITGFAPQEIQADDDEDIEDIDTEEKKEAAKEQKEANALVKSVDSHGLKYKMSMQVSGTPYYILASNEMLDKSAGIITKVSFTDMLKARDDWNRENNKKDPDATNEKNRRKEKWTSPYFGIPNLRKIGLSLSDECRDILKDSGYTSSMTVLFETKDNDKFKHERAIKDMMKAIFGDGKSDKLAFMKNKQIEGKKICKHTMIVLPRIKACAAMEKLLNDLLKGGDREILNLTNGSISNVNALNKKLDDIENRNKKSIILTVNRMLTGTSIPMLDSMLYMKNAKSPQEYDQNIFRLCTRNVRTVIDDETGETKKINLKDNVYLIDFNIDNTLQMMANSAKMKAMADINDGSKEPITDLIEKYMKEDAEMMPLWTEGKDEILGKMEKIDPDNLMKVYTKYNENKSISDIVNSEVNVFGQLFQDTKFQDAIRDIDVYDDNGKIIIVPPKKQNEHDIETPKETPTSLTDKLKNELRRSKETDKKSAEERKIIEMAKRKFIALSKKLLYLNICLDVPYNDFDKLLADAKTKDNKVLDELLENFEIDIKDTEKVYKTMKTAFKAAFNQIFTRINLFYTKGDKKLKEIDKFNKSVEGLGKVAKNEVMTPNEIVDKMIAKLDDSEYKNAQSILLINEKKGEFLQGLIRKFGKDIIKKCKIIPSSMIGKQLTTKMLKTQGLSDYINNIIILEDYDKSGKIDVKDFLDMKNEDIKDMNNGKRFDIVLMNPPYGMAGASTLHLQFIDKCLDIANKQIDIMPIGFALTHRKKQDEFKERFDKYLISIDEEDKKLFGDITIGSVAVYYFDNTKNQDNIKLSFLTGEEKEIKSLLDINAFENNIENKIYELISSKGTQQGFTFVGLNGGENENNKSIIKKYDIIKEYFDNHNTCAILIVSNANGKMNGKYMSSKIGQIFTSYNDFYKFARDIKPQHNILAFNNKEAAENCKIALENPVLRFILYRIQDDQHILLSKCYKHIPNIDWSDDRVKTDEGLLEVCGCPKDKCKEYAEYCKKIIDEVDKKN